MQAFCMIYRKSKTLYAIKARRIHGSLIFLGANQDAITEAAKIGIDAKDTLNFEASGDGIRTAYSDMSLSISTYRKK